uniref:NAD(+) kinase n=1 Tax=Bos mutus grunniens TaxID=30521 RepID=A0A8B9YR01_BOSMU
MEQEKVNGNKEPSAEASSYRCSACHGDEDWGLGHPLRGRAKSRSLSAAPVLASAREFRRTRSLHGPCPVTTFGPKACVLQNPQTIMHIQDPASQRLTWNKSPKSVLVIKKIRDASLLQPFKELCAYLMEENNMIVYVEKKVLEDPALLSDDHFGPVKRKFCTFREDYDDISNQIDLIICLGGDGTLLYASSLFQGSVPPVMAFHLGSLGFLTPFNFENFQSQVTQVIQGNAAVVLRSRLKVRVVKEPRGKKVAVPNGISENGVLAAGLDVEVGKQAVQYQVLNEVVIDRGPSSYLSNVDVYLDGHLITTVQGDGVIVSTPTGSTAYAAAAGASMIHPNVPAIMVTPICPHSLSFRPIVVPAGVELKVRAPTLVCWSPLGLSACPAGGGRDFVHSGLSSCVLCPRGSGRRGGALSLSGWGQSGWGGPQAINHCCLARPWGHILVFDCPSTSTSSFPGPSSLLQATPGQHVLSVNLGGQGYV